MKKQKIFLVLITLIISILLLIVVINLVFKKDTVNEGKCRVTDAILASSAELANKSEANGKWSIDLSQRNKLSFLINVASDTNITRVYLKDLTVKGTNNVVFEQLNSEIKVNLSSTKQNLDLEYTLDENNQMKIELVAINENVLKNWSVPEDIKEIIYDGRIFSDVGIKLKDIEFKLSFKLCIEEKTGKTNEMKVEIKLPNEELITNGADVRRLSTKDFKFKVK